MSQGRVGSLKYPLTYLFMLSLMIETTNWPGLPSVQDQTILFFCTSASSWSVSSSSPCSSSASLGSLSFNLFALPLVINHAEGSLGEASNMSSQVMAAKVTLTTGSSVCGSQTLMGWSGRASLIG